MGDRENERLISTRGPPPRYTDNDSYPPEDDGYYYSDDEDDRRPSRSGRREHRRERSVSRDRSYDDSEDEHLNRTRREEYEELQRKKIEKHKSTDPPNKDKDLDLEAQQPIVDSKGAAKVNDGLRTISLFLVGIVAVGVLLIYLEFILVPLILARFLVYAFQPFINVWIGKKKWPIIKKKTHVPRWIAVILVFLFLLGIFLVLGFIVYLSIKTVVDKSDLYLEQLDVWRERIIQWGEDLGFSKSQVESWFPDIDWVDYFISFVNWISNAAPQAFLVLLFVSYMLFEYDEKKDKSKLRRNIDVKIRSYILAQGLISIIAGIVHGATLFILGIDLAMFFGLMNFVFSWIPNIGAIIAVALPIPIILLTPGTHWIVMLIAIGFPIAFQFISGQFIEPRILSKAVELPALTVIVSLMFWGGIWGIIGAMLSIPLTVAVKLYLEDTDHPVARFLAGLLNNLGCT